MTARHASSAPATLTGRQREVLALVARGMTNFEIAQELGISLEGAKYHVREVMGKLGVDSREEAAAWYRHQRRPGQRVAAFVRGLAPVGVWWKAGAGAAACVAVAAAGLFAVLALTSTEDTVPPASDPGEPPLCGPDDAVFEVFEADPMDGIVLLVVTGVADSPCRLEGSVDLILTTTDDPAASSPVLTVSTTEVEMVLDRVRENIVHANWRGYCGTELVRATAVARQGDGSVVRESIGTDVVHRPGCDVPLSLEGVFAPPLSFRPDLGPVEELFCYPESGWVRQCEAIDLVNGAILTGDLGAILEGVRPTQFECGVEGLPEWLPLCEGQGAGTMLEGMVVDLPGIGLGAMSLGDLRARLSAAEHARVATIGCGEPSCGRFAIGIALRGDEPALYLLFESAMADNHGLMLVGFPTSEKVMALRRGGRAAIQLFGEAEFTRVIPAY